LKKDTDKTLILIRCVKDGIIYSSVLHSHSVLMKVCPCEIEICLWKLL